MIHLTLYRRISYSRNQMTGHGVDKNGELLILLFHNKNQQNNIDQAWMEIYLLNREEAKSQSYIFQLMNCSDWQYIGIEKLNSDEFLIRLIGQVKSDSKSPQVLNPYSKKVLLFYSFNQLTKDIRILRQIENNSVASFRLPHIFELYNKELIITDISQSSEITQRKMTDVESYKFESYQKGEALVIVRKEGNSAFCIPELEEVQLPQDNLSQADKRVNIFLRNRIQKYQLNMIITRDNRLLLPSFLNKQDLGSSKQICVKYTQIFIMKPQTKVIRKLKTEQNSQINSQFVLLNTRALKKLFAYDSIYNIANGKIIAEFDESCDKMLNRQNTLVRIHYEYIDVFKILNE